MQKSRKNAHLNFTIGTNEFCDYSLLRRILHKEEFVKYVQFQDDFYLEREKYRNVPFPMFVFCVFEGLNFERFTARGFDLFFRLFEDRLPPGRISSDTKHSKNTGSIGKRIMPLFPLPPRPIAPAPKEYGHAPARRKQSY